MATIGIILGLGISGYYYFRDTSVKVDYSIKESSKNISYWFPNYKTGEQIYFQLGKSPFNDSTESIDPNSSHKVS